MARDKRIVIGLLGGIGAGKTTVARLFGEFGAEVVAADALVHGFLRRPAVRRRIEEALDLTLSHDDTALRRQLAERVFTRDEDRGRLEAILHPLVEDEIRRRVRRPGAGILVLDVPLLLEAHMEGYCDRLLFVTTPERKRLRRVARSRNWSTAEVRARQKGQLPLPDKEAAADWTIDNGSRLEETRAQIHEIVRRLSANQKPKRVRRTLHGKSEGEDQGNEAETEARG